MKGCVRQLTLRNCQVDQAGEVSYQALNAITTAMLNVKGRKVLLVPGLQLMCSTALIHELQHKGLRSTPKQIKNVGVDLRPLILQYLVRFW